MFGIVIAVVVVVGGAIGAAKHDGMFKKGYDTTYKDTVAFEKQAALNTLKEIERIEKKEQRKKIEKEEEKKNEQKPARTSPQI